MKIAVVTGICVDHDAISASAVEQAEMLAEIPEVESVTLVTQYNAREHTVPWVAVPNAWWFIRHNAITDADLVIFHWGIEYRLFDALPLVAAERKAVVYFHNVTPPDLVPIERREQIERSLAQIQLPLLTRTDVWTPSNFNIDTLVGWGFDRSSVRLVPFSIERPPLRTREPQPASSVRFLTVGRLVPAKGAHVAVEAMRQVVDALAGNATLIVSGSSALSHSEYIDQLEDLVASAGLAGNVTIRVNTPDTELERMFEQADVLVSPSFHEGLCVPIVEGYRAGCRVIGSDAGNLPYLVQPPDPVVPVGDADALAAAMIAVGREVLEGSSSLPPGVDDVVAEYSRANVRAELERAVREITASGVAAT